jgi:hypothetical protein
MYILIIISIKNKMEELLFSILMSLWAAFTLYLMMDIKKKNELIEKLKKNGKTDCI